MAGEELFLGSPQRWRVVDGAGVAAVDGARVRESVMILLLFQHCLNDLTTPQYRTFNLLSEENEAPCSGFKAFALRCGCGDRYSGGKGR